MNTGSNESGQRRKEIWIGTLLALLTIAVFAQVAGFKFVQYDDKDYVVNNGHIQSGLTPASVAWAFTTGYAGNWHPLTWLSHMLDFQLYGLKAGGHHLTSLFFHVGNVVLLFVVLRSMTGKVWRAAMVAALFAWHPLHVESVAWVSERKDVLSTFFGLLTLWAYAGYVKARRGGVESMATNPPPHVGGHGTKRTRVLYGLALMLFALGLMAKPMLVTLPFVLLLLDFWPLKRSAECGVRSAELKSLLIEKIPFFILSAGSSFVTYRAQQAGGAMHAMEHLIFLDRAKTALVSYARYLGNTFWPADLAFFYPLPLSWAGWQVVGATVLLVVITAVVAGQAVSRPYLAVGWFWYVGTLVPVIGLVQVGAQAMADRYTYVPLIGIFIMVVWGLAEVAARWPVCRVPLGVCGGLGLAACLVLTWRQVGTWRNSVTLFTHAVEVTPDNFVAENLLGAAYVEQDKYDDALQHYDAALKIVPGLPTALCNLGTLYFLLGQTEKSEEKLRAALVRSPDMSVAHHYLARILEDRGRLDEALAEYAVALAGQPEDEDAHKHVGIILARLGRKDEAVAHFREAVRLRPGDADAYYDLGMGLVMQGRRDEAIVSYRNAVRLDPSRADALNELAWLLATHPKAELRNGAEAVRLAEKACELSPDTPQYFGTLDAAYAEAGRFPEAIATAEKARALALRIGATNLATAAESRLALYRSGRAYHQD